MRTTTPPSLGWRARDHLSRIDRNLGQSDDDRSDEDEEWDMTTLSSHRSHESLSLSASDDYYIEQGEFYLDEQEARPDNDPEAEDAEEDVQEPSPAPPQPPSDASRPASRMSGRLPVTASLPGVADDPELLRLLSAPSLPPPPTPPPPPPATSASPVVGSSSSRRSRTSSRRAGAEPTHTPRWTAAEPAADGAFDAVASMPAHLQEELELAWLRALGGPNMGGEPTVRSRLSSAGVGGPNEDASFVQKSQVLGSIDPLAERAQAAAMVRVGSSLSELRKVCQSPATSRNPPPRAESTPRAGRHLTPIPRHARPPLADACSSRVRVHGTVAVQASLADAEAEASDMRSRRYSLDALVGAPPLAQPTSPSSAHSQSSSSRAASTHPLGGTSPGRVGGRMVANARWRALLQQDETASNASGGGSNRDAISGDLLDHEVGISYHAVHLRPCRAAAPRRMASHGIRPVRPRTQNATCAPKYG